MARKPMSEKLKETIKKEFNYKCAICGSDNPHMHHIDENHANDEIDNLLPLCPNCHLSDQHNPTRKIEIPQLQLFRKYKDPAILKPQFHPIYKRILFLELLSEDNKLDDNVKELMKFIETFEKGTFYAEKIEELIAYNFVVSFSMNESSVERENRNRERNIKHKEYIIKNRDKAIDLIIELLRYQKW